MNYKPGPYDQMIDVARLQEVLAMARAADPGERARLERQVRNYLRKMRTRGKKELEQVQRVSSETLLCEFSSFEQWVNKARSWLGGISGGGVRYKKREKCICLDAKGRVCRIGADFQRAKDEGAFPVKAYQVEG